MKRKRRRKIPRDWKNRCRKDVDEIPEPKKKRRKIGEEQEKKKNGEKLSIDIPNKNALFLLSSNGDYEKLRFLLDNDTEIVDEYDLNKMTPLMFACRNGHKKVVRLLLTRGAKSNFKDKNENTSLIHASIEGRTNVIPMLLRNGASRFMKNDKGKNSIDLSKNDETKNLFSRIPPTIFELVMDCNVKKVRHVFETEEILSNYKDSTGRDLLKILYEDTTNKKEICNMVELLLNYDVELK